MERTYLLHVPAGLVSGQPVPVVFVFHGLGEAANLIQQASGMNSVADANGFIAVYPNGSGPDGGRSWNAGRCCGYAHQNNVDDEAFVRQILADLETITKVDAQRVYASGFSNGGLLSYRLACDMADTFATVAPVAGVMLTDTCEPSRPISIIDFHGLTDRDVPFAGGGSIPDLGTPFPPVEESLYAWAKLNGCTESSQVEKADLYTHISYPNCRESTDLDLYLVTGVGHAWPSLYIIQASQMMWEFFKAHPKP